MCTLSPALFVWMMRACSWPTGGAVASVAPRAQAASVCHSGSSFDVQCLPPSCCGSPPAASASGWRSKPAAVGVAGDHARANHVEVRARIASLHVAAPSGSGFSRIGVPEPWHETQRALPTRLVVKIGSIRALKKSKSSVGGVAEEEGSVGDRRLARTRVRRARRAPRRPSEIRSFLDSPVLVRELCAGERGRDQSRPAAPVGLAPATGPPVGASAGASAPEA